MKKLILLLIAFFLLGYVPLYAFPPTPRPSIGSLGGAPADAHYLTDQIEGGLSAEVVVTADGKSLVMAANYAAMKALTGWYTATGDLDAELQDIAGLTFADDKIILGTGAGTIAMADCTVFAQSILDDADEATFKATVNLEAGTDFYSKTTEDAWRAGVTQAEMGYVDGITSDAQTQFDAKLNIANPTFTGTLTVGSAALTEQELENIDGVTTTTTQLNYLNTATGTTGTNTTNLVYSESPQFTGTPSLNTATYDTLTGNAKPTPQWVFRDSDNAGTDKEIAKIYANATTVTDGAGDGDLFGQAMTNGSEKTGWKVDGDGVSSTQCSFQSYDEVQMAVVDWTTNTATGDGKFYFHIGPKLQGLNLVYCHAEVITAGTTNTTDIQIYNLTQTADMLSTKITLDTGETGSDTAATPYVIDAANDDVALNDVIRVDVDAVHTTPAAGLIITLGFAIP